MKKILVTWAAVLCCAMTAQAQLLYKISGGGLKEPSYIVGTNHYAAISFVDSIPGLRRVMNDTQQVYGETKKSAPEHTYEEDIKYLLLPDGTTIDSLLSADEMKRLTAFMVDSCEIDADDVELYLDLKPFPLAAWLSAKCDGSEETLTSNGDKIFDKYFEQEALAQGKEIGGLETSEVLTICEKISLERQKHMLMCTVDHHKRPKEKGSTLKTYYSQDLEAIWKEFNDHIDEDCAFSSQEMAMLLTARNLAWMEKIPTLMSSKSTLFTVGCLHLPGPDGVLNLLRQAGYTVEAVTK